MHSATLHIRRRLKWTRWQKTQGDRTQQRSYAFLNVFNNGNAVLMRSNRFLPRDARSASAVLLLFVVRPFVCPSVCLSARNVDVPWAYRLD